MVGAALAFSEHVLSLTRGKSPPLSGREALQAGGRVWEPGHGGFPTRGEKGDRGERCTVARAAGGETAKLSHSKPRRERA